MRQTNQKKWVALIIALGNLALVYCFPPYDYLSIARGNIATFAGFSWRFADHLNHVINTAFLSLEIFVILINFGIAWLLLSSTQDLVMHKKTFWQHGVLWLVAINLVVMLLFPPFQHYSAISKTFIPSFEGFYFVFADNSMRQLVTAILFIEIALLLINAGLLLLFFNDHRQEPNN